MKGAGIAENDNDDDEMVGGEDLGCCTWLFMTMMVMRDEGREKEMQDRKGCVEVAEETMWHIDPIVPSISICDTAH